MTVPGQMGGRASPTPPLKIDTAWIDELRKQLDSAKAFAASRAVKTEEGRELIARLIQLLETLIDGKPSTVLPSRHHE